MGKYSKKGSYAGYDRNNKEREALDYYATPPQEVTNIFQTLDIPKDSNITILDPCCGGGHMLKGIEDYYSSYHLIGTDIQDRGNVSSATVKAGKDFLADDYAETADIIVLNPPFSVAIPFIQKSLSLTRHKLIVLCRLQLLETVKRYEQIFADTPPQEIYVYVDRIACYQNGDFSTKPSSIQAYAWYIWDKDADTTQPPHLHWIRKI